MKIFLKATISEIKIKKPKKKRIKIHKIGKHNYKK